MRFALISRLSLFFRNCPLSILWLLASHNMQFSNAFPLCHERKELGFRLEKVGFHMEKQARILQMFFLASILSQTVISSSETLISKKYLMIGFSKC
jgi:hypothetical protein